MTQSDDPIITANDVFLAGHCIVPGLRDWCVTHSLNFRTFVKHGYPASVLLATDDELAKRVIRMKGERNGR